MPLPNDRSEQHRLFLKWANGNQSAAALLAAVASMARQADDIADGDVKASTASVGSLLHLVAVEIAANAFFQANAVVLAAALSDAILAWEASEIWRRGNRTMQTFGFTSRDRISRVASTVALLTGGADHARAVMLDVHEVCNAGETETVDDWAKEND